MGGPPAVAESSTGRDREAGPPAFEEGSTDGGLVGDPPGLEGGFTDGDLVVVPMAVAGVSTDWDPSGGPPVLVGGSTNGGSRDRRVGAQSALRQARADRSGVRLVAVHEHGGLVGEADRPSKAANCPASSVEGGGSPSGLEGAVA